ncbi:MAG: hypothetical protein A3J37_07075 [Alphaproteobacteria bacterium RIFCSPHIGHO2_12_FULL_45_9]|nr:MAG: hypothetical protein A3J37_07075 [Alphaproteobacteria bacterium RIFCSPHIGHO2_12_FULL_45_9]
MFMSKNVRLRMMDFQLAGGKDVFLRNSAFDLSPAINAILDRVEKVRSHLNGRPLVVLMGEDHRISSHIILQLLTLSKLHRKYKRDVGFSAELPYNVAIPLWMQRGHSIEEAKIILSGDSDGQLSLKEILNRELSIDAIQSHGALWNHCLTKGISTCFADAAEHPKNGSWIDWEDEKVREAASIGHLNGISHLNATTSVGVDVRNIFMSKQVASHMKCSGIQVMVMGVGAAHIFGLQEKYEFEGSLARHFERANIPFIAIMPFGRALSIHQIPTEASRFFGHTIGIVGMDETSFPMEKIGGTLKEEADYISAIIQSSGELARAPMPI